MRFMAIVKSNQNDEASSPPNQKLMEAVGKLAEELIKSGVLLDTAGLLPTSFGTRIRVTRGKMTVKDGPFTEAKEIIGGYAILQVRSKEEAIELGRRFMQVHVDIEGAACHRELEVRQIFDPAG